MATGASRQAGVCVAQKLLAYAWNIIMGAFQWLLTFLKAQVGHVQVIPIPLGEDCRNSYEPQEEAESGAEGIALLLLGAIDEKVTFKRVRNRKTGFDFWVGDIDDAGMFQHRKRLEVSGILSGSVGDVNQRVREKKKQTEQSAGQGPAVVVVVEFSRPRAWVEEI